MKKRSWKDPSYYLKKIHVDENCLSNPHTQEILNRAGIPWNVIPTGEKPVISHKEYPENLTEGKQHLFITENKGEFVKPCPATKVYRCCDYTVINSGMNCPIDCSYCILQAYLNNPYISYYVNIETMLTELDAVLDSDSTKFYRIGTGEFTDSLALDRLTGLSKILVEFIAGTSNAMLELKTKSGVIENLQDLDHNGKTVISWSLNSSEVLQREEIRAATLEQRLEAAAQCIEWGYSVAFHFDPIIDHSGWENGYRETIDQLFGTVDADKIVWISLGGFRYIPQLKQTGLSRFPGSPIYFQEFIEGLDGKSRYFRTNRVKLYASIYQQLKKYSSDKCCIYFCMESDEIWQEVMGFTPEEKGGLSTMLDRAFLEK